MLKNYFKIALRNLLRNKGFSVINISGLAIGMASAIIILLWVQNEVSFDRFHANDKRLYEVWENDIRDGGMQSGLSTQQLWGLPSEKIIRKLKMQLALAGTSPYFSVTVKNA